ncbi:MAG TPA: 30S ribosomal protein S5 [Candidatus Nanoarchaeia archaeon]|nr:30S ribosomal protein S5 [Candidatus Nanoarchaeia archaeon]
MAEKLLVNKPKELIEATPEELSKMEKVIPAAEKEELPISIVSKRYDRAAMEEERQRQALDSWVPKTELGKLVKTGKIKDIDEILLKHKKIVEAEITDLLLNLSSDLLLIGQAKGKFGGGKRRAWRQTQKKTMEGNVTSFSCMAVVGDKNGHVGIGMGKAKETLPSRTKALRNAKLNIIKVTRGFETREEPGAKPHTVPFVVEGKCGSVRLKLIPAPRGTGLAIGDECKKILRLAGIEDVYSATKGQTRTVFNFATACIEALKKIDKVKL